MQAGHGGGAAGARCKLHYTSRAPIMQTAGKQASWLQVAKSKQHPPLDVKSMMSSTSWKARPTCRPYSLARWQSKGRRGWGWKGSLEDCVAVQWQLVSTKGWAAVQAYKP